MAQLHSKAAKVYARTLLELGASGPSLDAIRDDMIALCAIFAATPALAGALQSPVLAAEQKAALVKPLSEKSGEWTRRLIRLLEIKGRLSLLKNIAEEFLRLDEENRHIRRARVVSAMPLTEAQLQILSRDLSAKRPGNTYLLHNDVDANLIAGFRVEEDDFVTDASLRHKLNVLRQKLAA